MKEKDPRREPEETETKDEEYEQMMDDYLEESFRENQKRMRRKGGWI